jgi:polysaccharide deacetylase family protein (PEP-CTERM system associated)
VTHGILTFDIEDWFQVENLRLLFPPERWDEIPRRVVRSTTTILEILREYGIRSTFFILGWVAEREPGLVRSIAAAGHEVASHGHGHILPMHLTPAEFREDILRARSVLQDITGLPVVGYRAPSFSLDRERLRVLAECGFHYDSSHHPFRLHDRYGHLGELGSPVTPGVWDVDGQITELGLPVLRAAGIRIPVSGGGYFRLYPGAAFRQFVRRCLARDGHYTMYLHSWEFDPNQPRVAGAGPVSGFRHYNNLKRTIPRIRALIEMLQHLGTECVTAREYLQVVGASRSVP